MAGLFDKQADLYLDSRPTYPTEWYSKLADLTPHHTLAWDVGTGNGQAAVSVAEHYEQVIGTDVSEAQLQRAMPHPRVRYVHTPLTITDDELIALIGGENSVDLVTGSSCALVRPAKVLQSCFAASEKARRCVGRLVLQ
ncbi:hypothetical protein ACFX1S_041527 [Malus domestica]